MTLSPSSCAFSARGARAGAVVHDAARNRDVRCLVYRLAVVTGVTCHADLDRPISPRSGGMTGSRSVEDTGLAIFISNYGAPCHTAPQTLPGKSSKRLLQHAHVIAKLPKRLSAYGSL